MHVNARAWRGTARPPAGRTRRKSARRPTIPPGRIAPGSGPRYRGLLMDRTYWDSFYKAKNPDIQGPTTFAEWCMPRLGPGAHLVELGCGNGRDAVFFAEKGLRVVACDQSEVAIDSLDARPQNAQYAHRPTFLATDFTRLDDGRFGPVDVVYSRFTLHAVTQPEASSALAWSARNLGPGGLLLVEVRSVKGSLYGLGEARERDAFVYNGHYRRFVRLDELTGEVTALGLAVEESIESDGLAVHKSDDPVVIRLVASRRA
jgi:SAM-dependent methyltransferase